MKFSEKLLPNQNENKKLYSDSVSHEDRMYDVIVNGCDMIDPNAEYVLQAHKDFSIEDMSTSPVYFSLLKTLITLKPYKNILEIGTFLGTTALNFSNIVGKDGRVVTIEKFDEFANVAKQNFSNNCKYNNIKLLVGDALEIIKEMKGKETFDFVFLDGNKENYYDYLILLVELLDDGGTIVVDDIFFHGDALNEKPSTEKGRGVKKVLDNLDRFNDYQKTIIPIGNGCLLLKRN